MASTDECYAVFGSKPGILYKFQLYGAQEAVNKANWMIEDGFAETYIRAANGRVFRPKDFHDLLKIVETAGMSTIVN